MSDALNIFLLMTIIIGTEYNFVRINAIGSLTMLDLKEKILTLVFTQAKICIFINILPLVYPFLIR